MDGFVLTHTMEPIDMPTRDAVRAWLPPLEFSRRLDPEDPRSMGMLVTPEYFPEVRHSHHAAMQKALAAIEATDADFEKAFGRAAGGLLTVEGSADATIGIVAMGSTVGTLRAGMADFAEEAGPARLIALRSFRPFPTEALRKAVAGLDHLIVLDRAISPGLGGILGTEVLAALAGVPGAPRVLNHAVGLGGRDIPETIVVDLMAAVRDPDSPAFSIFDADMDKLAPEDR
jgi:pyruvate ferredoxin oxidoreductase alpha subunit